MEHAMENPVSLFAVPSTLDVSSESGGGVLPFLHKGGSFPAHAPLDMLYPRVLADHIRSKVRQMWDALTVRLHDCAELEMYARYYQQCMQQQQLPVTPGSQRSADDVAQFEQQLVDYYAEMCPESVVPARPHSLAHACDPLRAAVMSVPPHVDPDEEEECMLQQQADEVARFETLLLESYQQYLQMSRNPVPATPKTGHRALDMLQYEDRLVEYLSGLTVSAATPRSMAVGDQTPRDALARQLVGVQEAELGAIDAASLDDVADTLMRSVWRLCLNDMD